MAQVNISKFEILPWSCHSHLSSFMDLWGSAAGSFAGWWMWARCALVKGHETSWPWNLGISSDLSELVLVKKISLDSINPLVLPISIPFSSIFHMSPAKMGWTPWSPGDFYRFLVIPGWPWWPPDPSDPSRPCQCCFSWCLQPMEMRRNSGPERCRTGKNTWPSWAIFSTRELENHRNS